MSSEKKHMMFTMITRGLLAVGGIALIATRLSDAKNKQSWPLMAMGAASTIPLALGVVQNVKQMKESMHAA